MAMDEATVSTRLNQAVENLLDRQPDLFAFTGETRQTEWNVAHHLANELQLCFPDLRCDIELVKPNYDHRRPDIVVHRRETHEEDLLVVEVKLDGTDDEQDRDTEKIRGYWFRPPLRYTFGAVVDLRTHGRHGVKVFKNE